MFLQRYCLLSDTKLSEIADDMIQRLSQPDREAVPSDDAMQQQLHALSAQQARHCHELHVCDTKASPDYTLAWATVITS